MSKIQVEFFIVHHCFMAPNFDDQLVQLIHQILSLPPGQLETILMTLNNWSPIQLQASLALALIDPDQAPAILFPFVYNQIARME